jgi:hypothetical protein
MVQASNSVGDAADSNIPAPAVTPLFIHAGDLDSTGTGNKNLNARVTITVHDHTEVSVSGVLVEGLWDDGVSSGSASCTTDGSGQCTMNKNTKQSSISFTVTSLSLSGFESNLAANHDPDEDGDGTTIVIEKDDGAIPVSIDSIDNNSGSPGDSVFATLSGTGFDPGANVTLENGAGKTPTVNISSITDTEIVLSIVIPDKGTKITVWELTVTNPDGGSDFVLFSIVP